ncbi:MAG TPA: MFS transporter [Caulobacteraceae bacterium]|jgi:MFS family permease
MSSTAPAHSAAPITPRQVAAAVIGNALEFYDFTVYATFADQIGHAFFPNPTPFISQIETLITFGVGFLLRPLGAMVIGRLADRSGRRPAMMLSFSLMGASILGLALTPTYAQIGVIAPCLVLLWRMCQGFALGGELGPTTAFLVEAAPPERRALYGAWQGGSQNLANIVGALVGIAVSHLFGDLALAAWGWRAAFLLGTVVLPFGLLLRRSLPETLHRHEARSDAHPDAATLLAAAPVLLRGFGLVAATTIPTYVFLYLTTYAIQTLHMGKQVSLAATLVSGVCGFAAGLIGGVMSDRFGRRAMLIWPRVFFLIVTWPIFDLIVSRHDALSLLGGTAVLAFSSALSTASVFVSITESLRKEVRVTGLGAMYAIAVAVFGGTTQLVVRWLIEVTGDPRSIASYTIAATLVGLVASVAMRETAVRRQGVTAAATAPGS